MTISKIEIGTSSEYYRSIRIGGLNLELWDVEMQKKNTNDCASFIRPVTSFGLKKHA